MVDKPSCLFGQHCQVKGLNIRKAHSSKFLRSHNRFQLSQCIFFSLLVCPHHYFAMTELISRQRAFGSWNKLIEYVGNTCATKYVTSPPAFEIYFSFQPVIFLAIHSQRSLKVLILFLPPTIDNPKYFSNSITIWARTLDFLPDHWLSVWAKKQSRLLAINVLAKGLFI